MKGFGPFDTTNSLYGSFYQREQDPVTNIPKFSKPDDEEQFYNKTLEMRKNYFDRYAHLYKGQNQSNNNAIDAEEVKITQNEPEVPLTRPHIRSCEMPEKDAGGDEQVTQTYHRNFEAAAQ